MRTMIVAFTLGMALPALADPAAPPAPDPMVVTTARLAKPKMICREIGETGSRLHVTKECATSDEWARRAREQRENLEDKQNKLVLASPQ